MDPATANRTVSTTVNMNCRCNAVGFKFVNIIWQPLVQEDKFPFEPSYYRVFFCTSPQCSETVNPQGHYQLGCTLNSTHRHSGSQLKELECTIKSQTLFDPYGFSFLVEKRNSSGVFISHKKTCRLGSHVECPKPRDVRVVVKGKKNLSVSWTSPGEMGDYAPLLCYKILYSSSNGKTNESIQWAPESQKLHLYTIRDLSPFTEYTLYIQCGLPSCFSGWGKPSDPITAMTEEEVPAKSPRFQNSYWSVSKNDKSKRDVTVLWELPPTNTWNGVLKRFEIRYWHVSKKKNDSLFIQVQNSSRVLQIKNGSAKEATLTGMNRFDDYKTEIRMCTSLGCGPKSSPWILRGDVNEMKKEKIMDDVTTANSMIGWIIPLASVPAAIIVLVVYLFFKRRRRCKRKPLDQVLNPLDLEPPECDHDESVSSTQNSYAEIPLQESDERDSPKI